MRVMVVNAGSSSLKVQLLEREHLISERLVDRWDDVTGLGVLGEFIAAAGTVDAVGHRVVHGGARFSAPVLIDNEVVKALESLTDLAPLHQPKAIAAIRGIESILPAVPQVACFDTAFHTTIPPAAATYALPAEWNARWKLRRYGFHGLSHSYASRRGAELIGADRRDLRIVSCHLGAGASLCAIRHGISVDTTMGFTPLEGLVMATRSGSVDPGLLLWVLNHAGMSVEELGEALEHRGGLAGLSGTSGDMRDVMEASDNGSQQAHLALDVYAHRLASLTAQMVTSAGGVDLLVFTAGVGEHAPSVRSGLVDRLSHLGLTIDSQANKACHADAILTGTGSSADIAVVTAREDIQISREVLETLSGREAPAR